MIIEVLVNAVSENLWNICTFFADVSRVLKKRKKYDSFIAFLAKIFRILL